MESKLVTEDWWWHVYIKVGGITFTQRWPALKSPFSHGVKQYCSYHPDDFVQEAYADFAMKDGDPGAPVRNLEACKTFCRNTPDCYSLAYSGFGYHPSRGFDSSLKNRCWISTDYVDSSNLFQPAGTGFSCHDDVYKPLRNDPHLDYQGETYRFDYYTSYGAVSVRDKDTEPQVAA